MQTKKKQRNISKYFDMVYDKDNLTDANLFFTDNPTKKERKHWNKAQRKEYKAWKLRQSEGVYEGFTSEELRSGTGSFKIDPYTGRGYQEIDWNRYLGKSYIDNRMHIITDNLATGAIGCDIVNEWVVVTVYDLDDSETSVDKVRDKIQQVVELLEHGFKVCVCCAAGINRSNTTAIGALMVMDRTGKSIKKRWNIYENLVKSKVSCCYCYPTIKGSCKAAVLAIEEQMEVNTMELKNAEEAEVIEQTQIQQEPYLVEFHSLTRRTEVKENLEEITEEE